MFSSFFSFYFYIIHSFLRPQRKLFSTLVSLFLVALYLLCYLFFHIFIYLFGKEKTPLLKWCSHKKIYFIYLEFRTFLKAPFPRQQTRGLLPHFTFFYFFYFYYCIAYSVSETFSSVTSDFRQTSGRNPVSVLV